MSPREDVDSAEKPIEQRYQVSIKSFTSEKYADLADGRFATLTHQKEYLPEKQKEAGPEGEGYLVSISGTHWHHADSKPEEQEVLDLHNYFVRNPPEVADQRAVKGRSGRGRIGISHATIMDYKPETIMYTPAGQIDTEAEPGGHSERKLPDAHADHDDASGWGQRPAP